MGTVKIVAENIKIAQKINNVSGKELAEKAEISQTTLSKILQNKVKDINLNTLNKIASAINVPMDFLVRKHSQNIYTYIRTPLFYIPIIFKHSNDKIIQLSDINDKMLTNYNINWLILSVLHGYLNTTNKIVGIECQNNTLILINYFDYKINIDELFSSQSIVNNDIFYLLYYRKEKRCLLGRIFENNGYHVIVDYFTQTPLLLKSSEKREIDILGDYLHVIQF